MKKEASFDRFDLPNRIDEKYNESEWKFKEDFSQRPL
jgi:hypothetical protein